ncbi:MAG: hypothetical protein IH599_09735, partial [Bacteroidales bacterium]|nr:hypothetical protein [Bacteroidales bacterium]
VRVVNLQVNAGPDHEICYGESVPLHASVSGSAMFDVSWDPLAYVSNPASINTTAQPDQTTIFNVLITDIPSGCTATDGIVVEVNPEQVVSVDLGLDIFVCLGGADSVRIGVASQPGMVYSWSPSSNLSDPTSSMTWYYVPTGVNYFTHDLILTVTDTTAQSCSDGRDTINISGYDPGLSLQPCIAEVCYSDSIALTPGFLGDWGDYWISYQWIPSTGLSASNVPNPFASPPKTTYYLLIANLVDYENQTTFMGCASQVINKVGVNPLPTVNVPDLYIPCSSPGDQKFDFPSDPSLSYQWEPGTLVSNPNVPNPYCFVSNDTTLYVIVSTAKGCSSGDSVRVIAKDTSSPYIVCPPSVNLDCTGDTSVSALGVAQCFDNCDQHPQIFYKDIVTPGACPAAYTVSRVWYGIDSTGNVDSCIQLINVTDGQAPDLTCPPDTMISCPADTSVLSLGTAWATDNCSGVIITHNDLVSPICGNTFSVVRTWQATDTCGNTTTCKQMITVQDTTAPVLSCPADVVLDCPADTSVTANGTATATDICDPAPTITHTDQVVPGCGPAFTVIRHWQATDGCGLITTCEQTITIKDTIPPVISCP